MDFPAHAFIKRGKWVCKNGMHATELLTSLFVDDCSRKKSDSAIEGKLNKELEKITAVNTASNSILFVIYICYVVSEILNISPQAVNCMHS